MTRPAFPNPGPLGYLRRARAVFKARAFLSWHIDKDAPYSMLGEFLYDADVMGA